MGSGIQKKIEKANGVLDRVNNAEKNIQMIYENIQKNFSVVDTKLSEQGEILDACVTLLGLDTVLEQVKKARIDKSEAESENKRVALETALAEGKIVVTDTIDTQSIIVGSEVDKDGNPLHPLRAQILLAQIKPELAEPLKGKKVGDVVETPIGTKFTVLEIYNIVIPTKAEVAAVTSEAEVPSEPLDVAQQQSLVEDLEAADGTVN